MSSGSAMINPLDEREFKRPDQGAADHQRPITGARRRRCRPVVARWISALDLFVSVEMRSVPAA